MKRICVFCGSRNGRRTDHEHAAKQLGQLLGERGYTLVYGGGQHGLMGAVAFAAMARGGEVIGVVPESSQQREWGQHTLTQLYVEPNTQARTARMAALADAFIALPGGYGTLAELFEIVTWAQVGLHGKPIGILNIAGYYDRLLAFVEDVLAEGFIRPEDRSLIYSADHPDAMLDALECRVSRPAVARGLIK